MPFSKTILISKQNAVIKADGTIDLASSREAILDLAQDPNFVRQFQDLKSIPVNEFFLEGQLNCKI